MATILSSVFAGAVRLRNSLYDAGALSARRLKGPVISVGNLCVGGSGKTPFVILLGELLKARGIRFDVLSRGYRRQTSGVALVDPGGLPRDFGDVVDRAQYVRHRGHRHELGSRCQKRWQSGHVEPAIRRDRNVLELGAALGR